MNLILIIIIVILTSLGQVLLKKGANSKNHYIKIKYIILGYTVFIIIIWLSYLLMQVIPLKYFIVIMSLNYIAIMLSSKIFLNESISKRKIIGTLLIAIGIYIFMGKP